MKKYVRFFASIVVMGVFLILAWSCSTDNNNLIGHNIECKLLETPISKDQEVFVKVIDQETDKPIPNVGITCEIRIYFSEKEKEGPGCVGKFTEFDYVGSTGSEGILYVPLFRIYNSESDKTEVQIRTEADGYYIEISTITLDRKDNGGRRNIYLLKKKLYP